MRKVNRLQRLARQEEESIIKRIFILSAISVVIIIIFFTVGVPFLGKFADLLDVVFKTNKNDVTTAAPVQAPIIDTLPSATNNINLTVTGFSNNASRVEIYLDSQKQGVAVVAAGRFKVDDIKLHDGENEITAKAFDDEDNASEFSQSKKIILDKKEPLLEVSTPVDSQEISGNNRVKVGGKTEKDAQVYANGFLANVSAEAEFEVQIPLKEGENIIEVKASDEAGNSKIVSIKVNFRK